MKNTFIKSFTLFILVSLSSFLLYSAPSADLWDYWNKSNEANSRTIDHAKFDAILQKFILKTSERVNLINYKLLKKERSTLDDYIEKLTQIDILNYAKKEQKPYWINLYNALTIQVIIDHYPVETILDIDISGFFSNGPWDKKLITISGQKLSLNDIEHRILRPIWQDHRIHYAVNCASYSCPNLHNRAYTAENTEAILNTAQKAYINSDRGVKLLPSKNILLLSSIFDWYQVDFGKNETALLAYLKPFLAAHLQKALDQDIEIQYDYDWSLNEVK